MPVPQATLPFTYCFNIEAIITAAKKVSNRNENGYESFLSGLATDTCLARPVLVDSFRRVFVEVGRTYK